MRNSLEPKPTCVDISSPLGKYTETASTSSNYVLINYDHVMAVLQQVMCSEYKSFASKKFEGSHNYDAWLTEFLDWIDQQDQSIKDFVSKKFGYEKTHESVKSYYDTLSTEESKKLKRQINISLCTLLKNSVDTTKVDSSFNDYHHTLEESSVKKIQLPES
ncbi:hypothetical protein CJJ07_001115 [Candidozyma auris]|nr:hypothetical protein CJJ07_001115 [[Candida] auris]QEL58636.1 hypothetical protein CJJ09_000683 [[Candida] auris]